MGWNKVPSLLTPKQVSGLLGIPLLMVHFLIKSRKLSVIKKNGRIRITGRALKEFIDSRNQEAA